MVEFNIIISNKDELEKFRNKDDEEWLKLKNGMVLHFNSPIEDIYFDETDGTLVLQCPGYDGRPSICIDISIGELMTFAGKRGLLQEITSYLELWKTGIEKVLEICRKNIPIPGVSGEERVSIREAVVERVERQKDGTTYVIYRITYPPELKDVKIGMALNRKMCPDIDRLKEGDNISITLKNDEIAKIKKLEKI